MIHCVAIDDEPIALAILKEYCSRHGGIRLDCFTSPEEGMEYISRERPDLVMLDIEMNSHNGLELARQLPAGTTFIFTTAFSEYALEGFNVNAVDFLHKPIFYPRFVQAMEKALVWIGKTANEKDVPIRREAITLKADRKNVVIPYYTITHIEAMDNYVKVYRQNLPTVVSQITMKEIEAMLPPDRFIRVHRSFIVAVDSIDSFSNRKVVIRGVPSAIPIGRTYSETFQNIYNNYRNGEIDF